MRISKALISYVAIAILVALVLVACGSPATPPPAPTSAPQPTTAPAQPTSAPAPTTAPAANPVTINWWHITTADAQKAVWQGLADQYMKDHPNVKVNITVLDNQAFKDKLATVMQSGNPPDLFQSWGGGVLKQYADAGLVQDLTAAMKQNGWGDSISSGALGLYSADGKVYGVPWDAGMVGFWYNKDLFKKAGIDNPPATWDEFLADVKKLQAAGITPIALGEKDSWTGAFWWEYLATREGGQDAFVSAYTRKGSFTDAPFVKAGQDLKALVDLKPFQDGFLAAAYPDHQVVMANGKAAMELMGQWAPGADAAQLKDPTAFNASLGWFPFPAVTGGKGGGSDALGGGNGFAIGKNAPPETIDFARFLTTPAAQIAITKAGIAGVPTVKGSESALSPLLQTISQNVANSKYYQLYYDQYMPPAVGNAVNDATQGLFAGTTSPEDVAKAIEAAAASALK